MEKRWRDGMLRLFTEITAFLAFPTIVASQPSNGRYLTNAPSRQAMASRSISSRDLDPKTLKQLFCRRQRHQSSFRASFSRSAKSSAMPASSLSDNCCPFRAAIIISATSGSRALMRSSKALPEAESLAP